MPMPHASLFVYPLVQALMTDKGDLDGIRGLHQDLIALSESQLRNVDRLWSELDARVDEFRKLLDKPQKNEASRKSLLSGMPKNFLYVACVDYHLLTSMI